MNCSDNSSVSGSSTFHPTHHCMGQNCTVCYPVYTWQMPSLKPHCCPVCDGRTTMPAAFYDPAQEPNAAERVPCKSCIAGIVWGA